MVTAILRGDESSLFRQRVLNSIISGPLDVDKLDYIHRDAIHTGVTFGRDIDRGRLLRSLTICIQVDDKNKLRVAEVGVSEKALAVAETVWRARREMFRQIYWHHTMRALKAMLMFAVRRVIISLNDDERDGFQSALHRFCLSPIGYNQGQSRIGDKSTMSNSVNSDTEDSLRIEDSMSFDYSHLCYSDDALISFMYHYCDETGKRVLRMIRRRQLFKRIAVISYAHDKDVFESIYNRYRLERLDYYPQAQEKRREKLENEILSRCQDIRDEIARAKQEDGNGPLILIDVPLKALRDPAGPEALWYVPEEQLGIHNTDSLGVYTIRKSNVQIERTTFDMEVGKIRVLAHPVWEERIRQKLNSEEIIELIKEGFRS